MLLMAAMHGLLDFGSDKNTFVAIGTFGFSVCLSAMPDTTLGVHIGIIIIIISSSIALCMLELSR